MNDVVASHTYGRGQGEYFIVPRKFNEMVEPISTTINNDIGEYV